MGWTCPQVAGDPTLIELAITATEAYTRLAITGRALASENFFLMYFRKKFSNYKINKFCRHTRHECSTLLYH